METKESRQKTAFSAYHLLDHYQKLAYHLEQKANWLIGTSSLILVILISRYDQISINYLTHLGVIIILLGCLGAIFNLMFILVPGILPSKRHIHALSEINLFEYRNMTRHFTKEQFLDYLSTLHVDEKEVDKLFSNAIYQITTMRLPSIAKKLRLGGWILITMLLVGSGFIVAGFL